MKLEQHLENRDFLIQALKQDIIGPSGINEKMLPLSTIGNITLASKEDLYKRYYQKENREEIIQRNNPSAHYVAGMLYPYPKASNEMANSDLSDELNLQQDQDSEDIKTISDDAIKSLTAGKKKLDKMFREDQDNDLVPQRSEFLPSSLGISFYIEAEQAQDGKIIFDISGGRYHQQTVFAREGNSKQTWWFRMPVNIKMEVDIRNLAANNRKLQTYDLVSDNTKDMKLQLQIYSRTLKNNGYLVTASVTNRTEISSVAADRDKYALFQSEMVVTLQNATFISYPRTHSGLEDVEEKSNLLIYRNSEVFGLGHNCSCDWNTKQGRVESVYSTFLPSFETKSMTPDIKDENGEVFSVSMFELTGKTCSMDQSIELLSKVVNAYEKWIEEKEKNIPSVEEYLQETAQMHMKKCRDCLNRMKNGIQLLQDSKIQKAFQLANQAMILQQVNGTVIRNGSIINDQIQYEQEFEPYTFKDIERLRKTNKGKWRTFQIAFILMALESTAKGESPERDIVDLIWFPTGGGKTEAYLGLAAFSMFYRRLLNPEDAGTDILMRYTLRLLTADQFQRSSRLISSMEYLRRENEAMLGTIPFSIGIWLGGDTTPNTNKKALEQLSALSLNKKTDDFIVSYCPWCGAKLGRYGEETKRKKRSASIYHGYKKVEKRLVIHCPDNACDFHRELPIHIVDETIYEVRPTFLLGTIDKFAMLAWRPAARTLFGLDEYGDRLFSPPNLIIQDELHLISGPLGTVAGLYEALIEELCTDKRTKWGKMPKIVCATATIRRFEEQIRNLYGRPQSQLFPHPGLEHDDSFFAQTAVDDQGNDQPGRLYVGIYSPTVQLMTMQVKTFSTLLQCTMELPEEERDPFYSLLSFYNSIRELGGGMTLTQTDIPNYFNQVRFKRAITDKDQYRWLNNVLELTSRLKSGEVAAAIQQLKVNVTNRKVMDLCLASNIIEVGVDIDRLSLMTIVGQPKTTAQYIQVSGRVGRRWWERPGLIVSLFANGRSRDKSHFEHFREYHERLYAQVEPTSVTPFSDPCIKKALPAIIIAYLRQTADPTIAASPENIKDYTDKLNAFKEHLLKRVELVDTLQRDAVDREYERFVKRVKRGYTLWEPESGDPNPAVMYLAGEYVNDEQKRLGVPVMMSMRSVDAQCIGSISTLFMEEEEDDF
ncbi:helicase [Bacillus sp. FJAT-29953]|nr:helicase [Bacillus sp. FJAT-29953]